MAEGRISTISPTPCARMDADAYASQSNFFDTAWYLQQVPEAAGNAMSPFEHYLRFGIPQGRTPNRMLAGDGSVVELGSIADEQAEAAALVELDVAAIVSGGGFDRDYYLEHNPDVAKAGVDPVRHFCRYGWKELRNPGPAFDVWWYWSRYMDPAREWMNPLVHYVLLGKSEGWSGRPTPPPQRAGHVHAVGKRVRRICLFAGYDPDGLVDESALAYVRDLSRHADVYYLADCDMAADELEKLSPHVKGAWAIRHGAYDFGSYSLLARELVGWPAIEEYDELLLVNDSCYLLRPLDEVFSQMDARRCDWWGLQATKGMAATRDNPANQFAQPIPIDTVKREMLDGYETDEVYDFHVGSYFLAFRKPVVSDPVFRRIVSGVTSQKSKKNIIRKYEFGITHLLIGMGFEFETFIADLYPFHPIYSEAHFKLISQGFPLFKRYLLTDNHYHVPSLSNWKERLLELVPDADVEEMERNLLRVADDDKLQRSFRVEVGKDGIARPPAMLNSAEFKAADIETPTFDHWWAFPVCAFDSTLGGNERAMFEEVKNDPSLKKIVLTRKRRIELDGENVVVVPLDSPEGQYHLLRSGQVFVKHSPTINAKWPLSPKLHNFINLWHGIPLKRFGPASLGLPDKDLAAIKRENLLCRAVVSSSKVDALAMASAFYPLRYQDVWITGLPRNDFILRDEQLLPADFRQELSWLDEELGGRRLVLYAPTFRSDHEAGSYRFSEQELAWLRRWLERTGSVLGIREHMADVGQSYARQLSGLGVLDLSSKRYPNIEVLYRRSSLLVTDYSSCAVDFMLTGRPVLSFAYDLEEYENEERGLFYDLDHVFPGAVCRSFAALRLQLEEVARGKRPGDGHRGLKLRLFFDHVDASSAERVAMRVKQLYLGAAAP